MNILEKTVIITCKLPQIHSVIFSGSNSFSRAYSASLFPVFISMAFKISCDDPSL